MTGRPWFRTVGGAFVLAVTPAATQAWVFWTVLVLATVACFHVAFLTRGT